MGRIRDGSVPFLLAEDLHLWLIAFTLLMVLTSSLAFVSSQFHTPPDQPLIEFVILMNWAIVFGASVLLWGLALLLNTRVAAWRLLFATMCMVVIPRSCLPFRVGECMLQYTCFIGFSFFTSNPTRKISFLCVSAVVITVISDIAWGALPPFLVAWKSIAGLTVIAAGHVGYQIIQTFSKQLREAKRLVLPLFSCSPTATEGDSRRKGNGFTGPSLRRGAHGIFQRFPLRRGLSHTAASGFSNDLQVAGGVRPLLLNKGAAGGVYSDSDRVGTSSAMPFRTPTRRYWTALENYGTLYNQAVHRRMKLCKDDMMRFATDIDDPGIWRKEDESQLFVVPSGQYGYVDSRWYLDMQLVQPHQWFCSLSNAFAGSGRTKGFKQGTPVMRVVPENAEESVSNGTPTACLRVDTPEATLRRFSRFHRSVSVGQGPEKHEASGSSEAGPMASDSVFAEQRRSEVESGPISVQPSPASARQREEVALIDREVGWEGKRKRKKNAFRRSKAMPLPSQKTTPGAHWLPSEKSRRYFVRTPPSTWRASFSGGTFLRTTTGSLGTRGLKLADDTGACGCLPQLRFNDGSRNSKGNEAYAEGGNREEVPMPKMLLGVFKDRAIERWYILWRADLIAGFYKETACFTLLICVLQCVFGMSRATIIEYLSELGSFQLVDATCRLDFKRSSVATLSLSALFRTFGRHLAQLGILVMLILPMIFIESRGGRNVWKFQLLGLCQAITQVLFFFVDVYLACFEVPLEQSGKNYTVARAGVQFVIGGYQIFPLLIIALSVQLRRIPQFFILFASVGSALATVFVLFSRGLEMKVLLFFTLSRALYGAFALMIARSFESIRRQLFSTHVLPFLLYLSTLANSRQVDNIVAMRTIRGCASAH